MNVKKRVLALCALFVLSLMLSVEVKAQSTPSSYALSWPGGAVDKKVTVPYSSDFNFSMGFTLSAWFTKSAPLTGTLHTLISKEKDFDTGGVWHVGYIGDETSTLYMDFSCLGFKSTYMVGITLADTWYHCVFTFEGVSKDCLWYRNSVLYSHEHRDGPMDNDTNPITIGSRQITSDPDLECWKGKIDNIQIYNRALALSEVQWLYNSGAGTGTVYNSTGLMAWWMFDEGSGTTLHDRSGRGHHGTISGPTWTTGQPTDWHDQDSLLIQTDWNTTLVSSSYTSNGLYFTTSASTGITSNTKVYCGDKGKPKDIQPHHADGGYDEATRIQTITWTHASNQQFQLIWETTGSGKYSVIISVSINYLPTPNAYVVINGENKTTDLLGRTTWELAFGDYVIWAYCQGKNQSQNVSINQDRTLGFNFTTTPGEQPPPNFIPIIITAIVIVMGFIFLSARRRK